MTTQHTVVNVYASQSGLYEKININGRKSVYDPREIQEISTEDDKGCCFWATLVAWIVLTLPFRLMYWAGWALYQTGKGIYIATLCFWHCCPCFTALYVYFCCDGCTSPTANAFFVFGRTVYRIFSVDPTYTKLVNTFTMFYTETVKFIDVCYSATRKEILYCALHTALRFLTPYVTNAVRHPAAYAAGGIGLIVFASVPKLREWFWVIGFLETTCLHIMRLYNDAETTLEEVRLFLDKFGDAPVIDQVEAAYNYFDADGIVLADVLATANVFQLPSVVNLDDPANWDPENLPEMD